MRGKSTTDMEQKRNEGSKGLKERIIRKMRGVQKKLRKRLRKIKINRKMKIIWSVAAAVILILTVTLVVLQIRDINREKAVNAQIELERTEQEQAKKEENQRLFDGAKKRITNDEGLQAAWESMWLPDVELTEETMTDFAVIDSCGIDQENTKNVAVSITIPGIPICDTPELFLFALNPYETEIGEQEPVAQVRLKKTASKTQKLTTELNYKGADSKLFQKFLIAVKKDGKYRQVSASSFITNPEAIAGSSVYTSASSIKGLLVDPAKLNSGELEDLSVKQAAYNIPLGKIMGQTTSGNYPTIQYQYNGKTYLFDGQAMAEFDIVFSALSQRGIRVTAIILNDRNTDYPDLIHPKARSGSTAPYYMFNAADDAGVDCIGAAATFLAERYNGSGHGTISNWVIANEINARKEWNYMEYTDVTTYTKEYAQAFRVFYNAVKSVNSAACLYMPLDQTWNRNLSKSGDYDAKDVLDSFNQIICDHGNIDWHLSHHPYPVPLTNAAFWNTGAYYNKLIQNSSSTPMICMKNIHVLTDYLQQEQFLTPGGEVRSVLLSELGFTSSSGGEGMQAAAFAYAYYIADANSHIDGLLLNRQTDAPEEVSQGLAFGLCNTNGSHKQIYQVYKEIDTANAASATEFAKGVIGISDWSEVIHQY